MKIFRSGSPPTTHPVGASQYAAVPLIHAVYYIVTGVWPVVSPGTFQLITGPKRDVWLVKSVGLLLAAIGAVFALAWRRKSESPEVVLLGVSSAAVLSTVDVVYYRKGILRWVYLADALAELALIAGWLLAWRESLARPAGSADC